MQLRTRMLPLWFSTILLHTHRPRPVPTSFFVVKNGWNKCGRIAGGMAVPESATVRRTPLRRLPRRCVAAETRMRLASAVHRIDAVAQQIGDHLANLARY